MISKPSDGKIIVIGIDPGVNTGIAVYNRSIKKIEELRTMQLHDAFELILSYRSLIKLVRIEDARKRKWLGPNADEKQQGAGSVKRDCKAWEDFLIAKGIPFELVPPGKARTKIHAKYFNQLTGWTKVTSNHARDAGMLVWGI